MLKITLSGSCSSVILIKPLLKKSTTKKKVRVFRCFVIQCRIKIRKTNPALIYGDIDFSLIDDDNRTLAYNRTYDSNEIIVAFNKSESVKLLHIPVNNDGSYKDALNNKYIYVSVNGFLNIELESTKSIILIYED